MLIKKRSLSFIEMYAYVKHLLYCTHTSAIFISSSKYDYCNGHYLVEYTKEQKKNEKKRTRSSLSTGQDRRKERRTECFFFFFFSFEPNGTTAIQYVCCWSNALYIDLLFFFLSLIYYRIDFLKE